MQAFRPSKSVVQLREKRAWNSSRRVTYGVPNDHTLNGHTNGVALIGEKSIHQLFFPEAPNSFRVALVVGHPNADALDRRTQVHRARNGP